MNNLQVILNIDTLYSIEKKQQQQQHLNGN